MFAEKRRALGDGGRPAPVLRYEHRTFLHRWWIEQYEGRLGELVSLAREWDRVADGWLWVTDDSRPARDRTRVTKEAA